MHKQPEVTAATRARLMDAFWALYRERPMEKITVSSIVKLAGVHRSTFYEYFQDVYDVLEHYDEPKPAYTTVATFLKILQNKDFVRSERMQGRQQRFVPIVSKDDYTRKVMEEVKDNFFDGSKLSFVRYFMKEEKISAEELQELIKMVEG